MNTKKVNSVIFLPGAITPAALHYEPLLKVLDGEVEPLLQDLEVYRRDAPPADYSLDVEVQALRRAAEGQRMEKFHLVAYSGGGAVALAFVAAYPDRVASLAVTEPAVIPSQAWVREETAFVGEMKAVMTLPSAEQMREFTRLHLRPEVPVPPTRPGPPPPWMSKRPAGLRALSQAFFAGSVDVNRFREFRGPVYWAIGSLTQAFAEREAKFMVGLFRDLRVEIYEGRHHFDPPQRAEPERFARALRELWARA